MQNDNIKIKKTKSDIWAIAGLMLFVTLLSTFVLSQQSLRLDEAQSIFQTSHSIEGLIQIISEDVHVPLYHITLHFWQKIWGNGVFAARMLSLSFFVLSIPLTYAAGRLLYPRKTSLYATALVALSPFLNWFGSEVRMYSMLMFITLLNQYFFIRIYKRKGNNYAQIPESGSDEQQQKKLYPLWMGFTLSALAGIYTHYFFFFILATQAIFIIANIKGFTAKNIQNFMKAGTLLILSFIPWIYLVVATDKLSYYQPILIKPKIVDVFNSFSQFMFGFHDDRVNTLIVSLWPLIGLFVFLMLGKKTMLSRDTAYLFLMVSVPIAGAFAVSMTLQPLFLSRYFTLIVPSFYFLTAWILSMYPVKIYRLISILILVGMSTSLAWQIASPDTPVKEDFKAANEYLMQNTAAQDVVVVMPPFTIYPTEYYYRGPAAIRTIPQWNRLDVGAIPEYSEQELQGEVEDLAGSRERMWLLVNYLNQGYEEDVVLYFETNYERLEKIEFSPGLVLYVYKMRYDIPENLRAALEEISQP